LIPGRKMANNEGVIAQVIGPVVDIDFEEGNLPSIYNAIKIPRRSIEGINNI
jgi:F-type H+-transporting ATPase subunit beta